MSNETLEKVIRTTEIGSGGGGILNAEQSNVFLDYIWDATVLGKQVRKKKMKAPIVEIDKVAIGERIVRGATEAVDTGENVPAVFSKISLTTKKLRLDWEISIESLEDNIEGENLDDHLSRMMATQFGNDLEDLAINGNVNSTDLLLKQYNGYSELLKGAEGHVLDAAGGAFDRGVINAAINALPRKYRRANNNVKFFASTGAIASYIYSLQAVETGLVNPESLAAAGISQAVAPSGNAGYLTGNAFGFQIQEVPLFREDRKTNEQGASAGTGNADKSEVWLTHADNLLWGIAREVKINREYVAKKDTIEYTAFIRQGVQVQHVDGSVVVKNIGPAASTL